MGAEFFQRVLSDKKRILQGLVDGAAKLGAPVLTEHLYKAEQNIFYAGNEPFGVYYIHHGMVKLLKSGKAGRMHITYMGGPGDLFGYRALLAGELYKITAQSHHHTKVSFIKAEFFLDYLKRNLDLSHLLLTSLSVELGDVEDRLVGAAQVSAEQRVARVLSFLVRTYGLDTEGFLTVEFSRTDLSELSDTAPETLMRCLGDLEKQAMIARDRKGIRIVDPEGLKVEAGL